MEEGALEQAIIPNAVGVDFGCGMCSLRTNIEQIETDNLKKVMGTIRDTVPVRFNHHESKQEKQWMPDIGEKNSPIVQQEYDDASRLVPWLG